MHVVWTIHIELIRTVVIELGRVPPGVNYEVLTTQIDDFVESYLQLPLEEVSMGQALKDMISIIHEHHIILPAKTFNLLRVVMMLEGTGKALNPKFSISSILQNIKDSLRKRVQSIWVPSTIPTSPLRTKESAI